VFAITHQDKMTLRVPTSKITNVGMRKLSEPVLVKKAIETLKGRARIKRTMWSRRAQEYEAKINSGDIIAIAEVVRDLFRSDSQPEQSYSERQLYEAALDRLSREIAVVSIRPRPKRSRKSSQLPRAAPRQTDAADATGEADGRSEADGDDTPWRTKPPESVETWKRSPVKRPLFDWNGATFLQAKPASVGSASKVRACLHARRLAASGEQLATSAGRQRVLR
jgi:RNA polymerase-interacting CarD/CdnL/TRCF family regulator